ncbi:3-deoxy-D-manno-octulosonic acid transferase [Hirschia litorea]|uniref:3-deoxy-D-manno-octulosonic acid transferase n=1 Tax=Hirschia litorea TaxID=1199156 RepID=A0ABW2IJS4_9PROT
MTLSLYAYSAATWLLEPLSGHILKKRIKAGKERASRLPERFGRTDIVRPTGKLIWMHGASVGETAMLLSILKYLKSSHPDLTALITSQTLTSADMIAAKAGPNIIHQMAPIDGPRAVSRFLEHWKPNAAILAEGEIWPNLILAAYEKQIPLNLINARMTVKSLTSWNKRRSAARKLFNSFDFIGAADTPTAKGIANLLGRAPNTVGNLKRAVDAPTCDPQELAKWQESLDGRDCFLAASTHEGEEDLAIAAFKQIQQTSPNALLILAPRHPERANAIGRLLDAEGLKYQQRSNDTQIGCAAPILLADTIGEMGLWMTLCKAVYLGGAHQSGIGGHNPIEPLKLRKPTFTGPHSFNFSDLMKALEPCNAISVGQSANELGQFWLQHTMQIEKNNAATAASSATPNWECVDAVFSAVDEPLTLTLNAIRAQLEE